MNDARIETRVEIDGDTLVGTNRYTAADLRFATTQVDDVELDVTASYPADAAARFLEALDGADLEPTRLGPDMVAELANERFSLRIDPVSFSHRDRQLEGTMLIDYRGDLLGDPRASADFATLAGVTSAELDLSVHKDLLAVVGGGTVAALVRAMARIELVDESDDEYKVQATFVDGELRSNGKPVDLPLLLGLLAAT